MKMLLHKIDGTNQIADLLTKSTARPVFTKLMPFLVGEVFAMDDEDLEEDDVETEDDGVDEDDGLAEDGG
ncbi:unnamed protein product [Ambrosiozyma monospora]|uniref:Unnamed protein product n=1 Tax=Ambrosiozyma monospora TaxID=43982 RepID=A0A9W6YUB4_AMBMO|nr:unnamed protein product [Ambrosiozyma monospora]